MRKARSAENRSQCASNGPVQVLVLSQHDAVRRQLVAYLDRSPGLRVHGDELSGDAITHARPDVVVLDLSQVGLKDLQQGLDSARDVGARVIALASIREPSAERAVVEAGGLYRLKLAGADGLAHLVQDVGRRPGLAVASSARARAAGTPA